MINLFKIIKFSYFLIFIIACNSSSSFDDETLNSINEDASVNQNLNSDSLNQTQFSLLALGDSYTIGEGVDEDQRWPNQFIKVAYENGVDFSSSRIIAETGWKSYDLINAIESSNFEKKYDYVSLLIGVNNQFNSRPVNEFAKLFKLLLKVFISFDISFLSKPSPNGDDPQSGMEIIKTLPFFFFKLFILINSLSKSFLNSLTGLELN